MDRLSALPDCLLLRILCNLGCLKEAAKTGALSKQWRYVWTNLPFEMGCDSKKMEEIRSFVDSVDAALTLTLGRDDHPGFNTTFDVSFYYHECFAPNVDLWLAKSKVKEVHLSLESKDLNPPRKYTLPQIIYSNSSLTRLSLKNCIFPSPATTVEWRYLKLLFLLSVDLPIGEIVPNCPLLNELHLLSCTGFNRIEIGGRKFRRMYLRYYEKRLLEISAPYMTELRLTVNFSKSGTTVRLENAQSLEKLYLNFHAQKWDSISVETLRAPLLMFLHLHHLKELRLSYACIKVISIMSTNGWRIANPRLKILGLWMAKSDVHSICGIEAMLESSPNLESLIITTICGSKEEDQESISWGPITRDDLHYDLLHLKTITFNVLSNSSDSGELTLTLAKILLKRAPFLEKIVIYKTRYLSTKDHDGLIKTVLNYPRSSQNVSVGKR